MSIFDKIKQAKENQQSLEVNAHTPSPEVAVVVKEVVKEPETITPVEKVNLPIDFTTLSCSVAETSLNNGDRQISIPLTQELEKVFEFICESLDTSTVNNILIKALKSKKDLANLRPDEIVIPKHTKTKNIAIKESTCLSLVDIKRQLLTLNNISQIAYELLINYANKKAGSDINIYKDVPEIKVKGYTRRLTMIYLNAMKLVKHSSGATMQNILSDMGKTNMAFVELKKGKYGIKRLEKSLEKIAEYTEGCFVYDAEYDIVILKIVEDGKVVSLELSYENFLNYRPSKIVLS